MKATGSKYADQDANALVEVQMRWSTCKWRSVKFHCTVQGVNAVGPTCKCIGRVANGDWSSFNNAFIVHYQLI